MVKIESTMAGDSSDASFPDGYRGRAEGRKGKEGSGELRKLQFFATYYILRMGAIQFQGIGRLTLRVSGTHITVSHRSNIYIYKSI